MPTTKDNPEPLTRPRSIADRDREISELRQVVASMDKRLAEAEKLLAKKLGKD